MDNLGIIQHPAAPAKPKRIEFTSDVSYNGRDYSSGEQVVADGKWAQYFISTNRAKQVEGSLEPEPTADELKAKLVEAGTIIDSLRAKAENDQARIMELEMENAENAAKLDALTAAGENKKAGTAATPTNADPKPTTKR